MLYYVPRTWRSPARIATLAAHRSRILFTRHLKETNRGGCHSLSKTVSQGEAQGENPVSPWTPQVGGGQQQTFRRKDRKTGYDLPLFALW